MTTSEQHAAKNRERAWAAFGMTPPPSEGRESMIEALWSDDATDATREMARNAAGVQAELRHEGGDDFWTVQLEGPGVTPRTAHDTDEQYARSLFAGMCLRYGLARVAAATCRSGHQHTDGGAARTCDAVRTPAEFYGVGTRPPASGTAKLENVAPAVAPRARAPRTDERLSDQQRDAIAERLRQGRYFVRRGGGGALHGELTATQLRSLDRMGLIKLSRSSGGLDGGWLSDRVVRVLIEHDERAAYVERAERLARG